MGQHKLVFDFHVDVYRDQVSEIDIPTGRVKILPFGGTVESELFTGKILPGGADVQITNAAGIRHMCARYMFEGTDYTGAACKLFVDNNGYFEPGRTPRPFQTCPTMITDSVALAPYLHQPIFRAEGMRDDECLHIRIYDVTAEE